MTLVNAAGVNVNDYLLALRQVPEPVLATFNATGWTYRIDFDYISELSKQLNMSCIGATSYGQKTIYISEASATLHEFGHFLDYALGFPAEHERLYLAESQNSSLRDYAKTNSREFLPIASSTGSHTALTKSAWMISGMQHRRLTPT